MPDNVSFAQGAAVPIAGKSALESMRELGLGKGDRLFIAGASGAIGTLVIQMAAAKGIRVAGSASARNHDYMKSLGAEKTVDYNDSDWQQQVREWADGGVDAALAIQPGTGEDSIKTVIKDGLLITVSGDSQYVVPERNITVRQMAHTDIQQEIVGLVNSISKEDIRIVLEKEYAFKAALDALQKTETRRARGKLIVHVTN